MAISLTKEQILEKLLEPRRLSLLILAISEDAKKTMTLKYKPQTNQSEVNIDITQPLSEFTNRILLRAIELAYDETLD